MSPKLRFFELAKKLSYKSDHNCHKLGCVIIKKNRIVGLGFNRLQTHTKSTHPFKSLHAEMSAIIGAPFEELDGSTAYVYRQTKNCLPAMAKPCVFCEVALRQAGVKHIYYTKNTKLGWEHYGI